MENKQTECGGGIGRHAMSSWFDANNNLWNAVSGHKDDCHARCKSSPTLMLSEICGLSVKA